MKKILLFFLILFVTSTSCSEKNSGEDSETIMAVLNEYLDGIKTRDKKKLDSVTTKDFVLFEDGKYYNNDSLINLLNTFDAFTGSYKLDSVRINVDNNIGRVYYISRGDFTLNDTTRLTYIWLESATFTKINGEWKMDFMHSTIRK